MYPDSLTQSADWGRFVDVSARYLSEAKQVATSFKASHSEYVPNMSRSNYEEDIRNLQDICNRYESPSSEPSYAEEHSGNENYTSKQVSVLQAEVTQLQRTITARKGDLKEIRSRLEDMRVRSQEPSKPILDHSQRQRLEELFREYSSIWRNICFVEHHLKENSPSKPL